MSERVRQVTLDDLPVVERLWAESLKEQPIPGFAFQEALELQRMLLGMVVGKELAGLALYAPQGGALLMVGKGRTLCDSGIYVTPEQRQSGLAGELLAYVYGWAKLRGFDRIHAAPYLENEICRGWLERSGFKPVQLTMELEVR